MSGKNPKLYNAEARHERSGRVRIRPNTNDDTNGGSWCGPYKKWQRVYDYDIAYGLTPEEAQLVLGGEVAMWTD
jgi:hypothetical protein